MNDQLIEEAKKNLEIAISNSPQMDLDQIFKEFSSIVMFKLQPSLLKNKLMKQ